MQIYLMPSLHILANSRFNTDKKIWLASLQTELETYFGVLETLIGILESYLITTVTFFYLPGQL